MANAQSGPASSDMRQPDDQYARQALAEQQRTFKRHKNLPRPQREEFANSRVVSSSAAVPRKYDLDIDTSTLGESSLRLLGSGVGSQSQRPGSRSRLPPTPPTHSRTSSDNAVEGSGPSYVTTSAQNNEKVNEKVEEKRQEPAPTTPTHQQTPPTPNLTPEKTPPGPAVARPKPRPWLADRIPSKATADSRTESFRTAPENPYSSGEDDDERSTLRPKAPSARTSRSTVRLANRSNPDTVGLGLTLESPREAVSSPKLPITPSEFPTFDGEWGSSGNEVVQEWDANLERHVMVKRRRAAREPNGSEVLEDQDVTPSNATKILRSVPLQDSPVMQTRKIVSDRAPAQRPVSNSDSTSVKARRTSAVSTRSAASTVVEAILVEAAPQRRQTLRHVRKQFSLRDSGLGLSSPSSTTVSLSRDEAGPRRLRNPTDITATREQRISTSTSNSVSSHKARRQVTKNGGIPVVVIPQRNSSNRSTREPSLRSTSSRRSRRSQSVSSIPLSNTTNTSKSKESGPIFERPVRRSRRLSESDRGRPGDERTIDFPPMIPARSSSLSAPTSRNVSRAGSLTADSLHLHDAVQAREDVQETVPTPRALSEDSIKPGERLDIRRVRTASDDHSDLVLGRSLSLKNTPFSIASVETNNTSHAEVSQAMAVNLYPHQNTSILMVDHSASHSSKPSESSVDAKQMDATIPVIRTMDADGNGPVTPPQAFSMDDVDSPLRNPRVPPPPPPPAPPLIEFIPATPSGMTPAHEIDKQLGNYYEVAHDAPKRRPSLLQRTFSLRRNAEYGPSASRTPGVITRTLSLTRKPRRDDSRRRGDAQLGAPLTKYPTADSRPPEEDRLHPFWRPVSFAQESDESESDDDEHFHRRERPLAPRRSMSARLKHAFAILPIEREPDHYPMPERRSPERRTIRRTPSGNLRVVEHRRSAESLRHVQDVRPYTAPEGRYMIPRFLWRTRSLSRTRPKPRGATEQKPGLLPTLSNRLNFPRRLSERKRERRNNELRQIISGPREVRDGVGDVIRRSYHPGEIRGPRSRNEPTARRS